MNAQDYVTEVVQPLLWQYFAVFLRVAAFTALLPAFGERSVPARVKLAIALSMSFLVAPLAPDQRAPDGFAATCAYGLAEMLIGLALGIGIRLFVICLQTAGAIAANATSLSQVLGGAAAEPLPAIGHVLTLAGLVLALIAGLPVRAIELAILSYDLFPPGDWPEARVLSAWGLGRIARSFSLAFTLVAPFLIASLLYNLALGAINRAMPQLMVAMVGAPVITFGGLGLLLLTIPVLLPVWLASLERFLLLPSGAGP